MLHSKSTLNFNDSIASMTLNATCDFFVAKCPPHIELELSPCYITINTLSLQSLTVASSHQSPMVESQSPALRSTAEQPMTVTVGMFSREWRSESVRKMVAGQLRLPPVSRDKVQLYLHFEKLNFELCLSLVSQFSLVFS